MTTVQATAADLATTVVATDATTFSDATTVSEATTASDADVQTTDQATDATEGATDATTDDIWAEFDDAMKELEEALADWEDIDMDADVKIPLAEDDAATDADADNGWAEWDAFWEELAEDQAATNADVDADEGSDAFWDNLFEDDASTDADADADVDWDSLFDDMFEELDEALAELDALDESLDDASNDDADADADVDWDAFWAELDALDEAWAEPDALDEAWAELDALDESQDDADADADADADWDSLFDDMFEELDEALAELDALNESLDDADVEWDATWDDWFDVDENDTSSDDTNAMIWTEEDQAAWDALWDLTDDAQSTDATTDDAATTDGQAAAVAWDIIFDDYGCYYTVEDGMASATICPDEGSTEPPKPIILQDAVATSTDSVAWDIIFDDFGCYYTVEDGLASVTICPDEDTDRNAEVSELPETEEQSIEEAWEEAVRELVNAIKDPVNKYIDQARSLEERAAFDNLNTEEDITWYLADNTVVDGYALSDSVGPQIAESLEEGRSWLEENAWWLFDDSDFNMSPMMKKKVLAKRKMQAEKRLGKSLKVPMVTKKTKGGGKKGKGGGKKGQWDDAADAAAFTADDIAAAAFGDWAENIAEAATPTDDAEQAAIDAVLEGLDMEKGKEYCKYYETCDAEGKCWEEEDCWFEVEDDDWQEKASDFLMDRVISYGFDPAVAEAWLEDKQQTWADIETRHREEKVEQLAQDVTELADEATGIFSNMLDDLTNRFPDLTSDLGDKINGLAGDALDEIQRAQDDAQAMIGDFISDMSGDEIELKQIGGAQASNNAAYGYAALALGAAAIITYSIRRRGVTKTSGISEPLIDDGFARV